MAGCRLKILKFWVDCAAGASQTVRGRFAAKIEEETWADCAGREDATDRK